MKMLSELGSAEAGAHTAVAELARLDDGVDDDVANAMGEALATMVRSAHARSAWIGFKR